MLLFLWLVPGFLAVMPFNGTGEFSLQFCFHLDTKYSGNFQISVYVIMAFCLVIKHSSSIVDEWNSPLRIGPDYIQFNVK